MSEKLFERTNGTDGDAGGRDALTATGCTPEVGRR